MKHYLLTIILIILFIFLKVILKKKKNEKIIYTKEQKLSFLALLIIPIIYLICTYFLNMVNIKNVISLLIILLPLTFSFKNNKDLLCSTEKIYYKDISLKEKKLFQQAHIKLIKTDDEKKVTYEKNIYEKIKNSRKDYDNYLIAKRCNIATYLPLVISYFLFLFLSFPFQININFLIALKIMTLLLNNLVYPNIPEDKDCMKRKPYQIENKNIQEFFFLIMRVCLVLFAITLPYMYFLANLEEESTAMTIFILLFIFSGLWLTMDEYSERPMIFNFLNIKKPKFVIFYIIAIIIITIIIIGIQKPFIGIQNYLACFLTSLFILSPLEIIKLARFTKVKGGK